MSVTDDAPTPAKFGGRLTALQRDIICVLSGCEGASGREIRSELEDYYETDLFDGRIYPNLDTLAERGFIEKSHIGGRENRYEITDAGVRANGAHQDWRSSWVEGENGE